jgi:hypothetical protein
MEGKANVAQKISQLRIAAQILHPWIFGDHEFDLGTPRQSKASCETGLG